MSEIQKKTLYPPALTLEEQADIQSRVIRSTTLQIEKADAAGTVEIAIKLRNLFNMEQKALTEIQRALMMQRGKSRKTRLVNDLTEQTATSQNDAAA